MVLLECIMLMIVYNREQMNRDKNWVQEDLDVVCQGGVHWNGHVKYMDDDIGIKKKWLGDLRKYQ